MQEKQLPSCAICGNHSVVINGKYSETICRHCSKRADTWGLLGTRKLIEFSKGNSSIPISEARDFCDMFYVGKASRAHEKTSIFKTSLKNLGFVGKIVGRNKTYDDYRHIRNANTAKNIREGAKGDKCELCGSVDELHLHHVIPCAWGGIEIAPNEVMTLCKNCHLKIHRRLKSVLNRELLIQYLRPNYSEIRKLVMSVMI